ncbi:hypothetical protein A8H38_05990 [Burkholderia thailandensis]|nr:hypothetical protein A8H38_05990 [Burkholderia thailandensis]
MTSRCDARRIASRVVRRPPAASRAAAGRADGGTSHVRGAMHRAPTQLTSREPKASADERGTTRAEVGERPASNDKSRTRNREPRPSNRAPRTANREPRTANREPRTANRAPRTANREPRTAHRAPRTANREPRTANREPRTAHRAPRTANREPRGPKERRIRAALTPSRSRAHAVPTDTD